MTHIVLISREFSWWRNALGMLAAIVVVPAGLVAALIAIPFRKPKERGAREVAKYLRDFLHDSGGEWDWDDFTSVPIADPALEDIRRRAATIRLPVEPGGTAELERLLAEAQRLR